MLRTATSALALVLLTLSACSGGDGPTGTTPAVPSAPTLTPLTDTARVGAMLLVDLTNASVTGDTVAARIGSTSLRLVRMAGNTFAAPMPELPAGQNTLQLTAGTTPVPTTITVLPGLAIADPLASINRSLDATLAAVPVAAPPGVSDMEWSVRRATLDSIVRDARTQVASLPVDQRLAIARLLAASQVSPTSVATSSLMLRTAEQRPLLGLGWFKLTPCQAAMKNVVNYGAPTLLMLGSMVFFILAPADPFTKAIGTITTGAAFAGSLLLAVDAFQKASITCGVITQTDVQDDIFAAVRSPGREVTASVQGAATPKRFFANRPVMQYPVGTFRKLSTVEVGKDAVVRQMSDMLDKLNTQISGVASKLPANVQSLLPSLPPRLGSPGGGAPEALPPSDVRIANVTPASVQLTATPSGQGLSLQIAAQVTDDVPFTYDVISTYDPTVKVTKSGVARPMMSAAAINVPATITGTRTITTQNGLQYGTLTCGGSATIRVKGGDTAEWRDFGWQITGPSTLNGSDPIQSTTGGPAVFESGDRSLSGSWYYTWRENDQPVYKSFTVTINITYFDRVTQTVKSVTPFSFQCI